MTHHRTYSRARQRVTAVAVALALTFTGAAATGNAAAAAPPVAVAVAPAPQATGKVMVTTADLNLRTSPSTSAKIITTLAKGTKVTVIDSSGSWKKVNVGKRTGWVAAKFLKAVAVKKKATVTVTSRTKSNVDLGTKLTFAGTTSKNLKGKTVALQIRTGSKWSTLKKAKVTSKLTFTVSAKATQAGAQKYRVYAPSTSTTKAATTKAYKYTVWSWYKIGGTAVDDRSMWTGDAMIGGVNFTKSVYSDWGTGDVWADYNVSYKCTAFRATIGMKDNSSTGAVRKFTLDVDSTAVELGSRGIGAGLAITVDITDANRIRLNATRDGNTIRGYAAYGTPQVYCSTAP